MNPVDVMREMTTSQIGLIFKIAEKDSLRFAETQAAIIWKMATGKYRSPINRKEVTGKKAVEQAEKIFGVEDLV